MTDWQICRVILASLVFIQRISFNSAVFLRHTKAKYVTVYFFGSLLCFYFFPEADSCWYKLVGPYLVSEGRITNTVVGYGIIWLCTVAPVLLPLPFYAYLALFFTLSPLCTVDPVSIYLTPLLLYLTGYGYSQHIFLDLVLLTNRVGHFR
jgi:hypothetical protein